MGKLKREFGEGPIYTISNYIILFFLGNVYFFLMNIPGLFMLLVFFTNKNNSHQEWFYIIFIIGCIPIAPAATALFSVMGKLIREKDISITKDFFKAYKTNFFQSLYFGFIEIIILLILFIDIRFFISTSYPKFIIYIIIMIMIFIFSLNLYVFPIISRFYLSKKDILKNAAYYNIKRFHITILNFASFLIIGLIFFKISTFILVFASSLICYLIMFFEQKILLEIEAKLKINA